MARMIGAATKCVATLLCIGLVVWFFVEFDFSKESIDRGDVFSERHGRSSGSVNGNFTGVDINAEVKKTLEAVVANLYSIAKTSPLGAIPPHLQPVVDQIKKIDPSISITESKTTSLEAKKPDVCPEKYEFDQLSGGFPYFYKGFNMVNCTGVPKFNSLITLVYNFVRYSEENLKRIPELLSSVQKVYSGIPVIAAVPVKLSVTVPKDKHTTVVTFNSSAAEMDVWIKLVAMVTTKYVHISRDVIHFAWFDRLERLVREINDLDAYVVASAHRALISGEWTKGCEQSSLRNYTLEYQSGYQFSKEECIFCHHVKGPFVTTTDIIKKFPLPASVNAVSGFAMWFLTLTEQSKGIVTCPDAMAFVTDDSRLASTKGDWLDLARTLQVEKIKLDSSKAMLFNCTEANTSCSKTKGVGLALSHCCRKKMIEGIKSTIAMCRESGIRCELHNETLLGALKFNGLLPWQEDVDMAIRISDFKAFEKLKPKLTEKGYTVKTNTKEKYYELIMDEWTMKIFTVPDADITDWSKTTVISYDGTAVSVPESPGLTAKTESGSKLYRHWPGTDDSIFPKCSKPGFHACLDRIAPDGNLQ